MRSSVTGGRSLFRRGRLERHRVPGDWSESVRYHSWVRSYHSKAGLGQSPRCARGRINLVRSRAECDKNKVCRQIATPSDSSGWGANKGDVPLVFGTKFARFYPPGLILPPIWQDRRDAETRTKTAEAPRYLRGKVPRAAPATAR